MSLTSTRIVRFCSISSTVAALALCTVLFAKSQQISSNRESASQTQITTQNSDRSSDLATRTWNEAANLEISQEHQLTPMVSPVEPIDWDDIEIIDIDTDFSLDF